MSDVQLLHTMTVEQLAAWCAKRHKIIVIEGVVTKDGRILPRLIAQDLPDVPDFLRPNFQEMKQ